MSKLAGESESNLRKGECFRSGHSHITIKEDHRRTVPLVTFLSNPFFRLNRKTDLWQ